MALRASTKWQQKANNMKFLVYISICPWAGTDTDHRGYKRRLEIGTDNPIHCIREKKYGVNPSNVCELKLKFLIINIYLDNNPITVQITNFTNINVQIVDYENIYCINNKKIVH